MRYLLPLLSLLLLTACPKSGPTPHVPDDTDQCPAACERLRELGCEEGDPLEDGTTCEVFCQETQDTGHALNPTCIKAIDSCGQIEACGELAR